MKPGNEKSIFFDWYMGGTNQYEGSIPYTGGFNSPKTAWKNYRITKSFVEDIFMEIFNKKISCKNYKVIIIFILFIEFSHLCDE